MADTLQTLIAMARDRYDPKVVSDWLSAYLGKRPLEAKRTVLSDLAQGLHRPPAGADVRAVGLVARVVQKLQAALE